MELRDDLGHSQVQTLGLCFTVLVHCCLVVHSPSKYSFTLGFICVVPFPFKQFSEPKHVLHSLHTKLKPQHALPTTYPIMNTPKPTPPPAAKDLQILEARCPIMVMGHGAFGVCIGFVELHKICPCMRGTARCKQCAGSMMLSRHWCKNACRSIGT